HDGAYALAHDFPATTNGWNSGGLTSMAGAAGSRLPHRSRRSRRWCGGNRRGVALGRLPPSRCHIGTAGGPAAGPVPRGGRDCRGRCVPWRGLASRTSVVKSLATIWIVAREREAATCQLLEISKPR